MHLYPTNRRKPRVSLLRPREPRVDSSCFVMVLYCSTEHSIPWIWRWSNYKLWYVRSIHMYLSHKYLSYTYLELIEGKWNHSSSIMILSNTVGVIKSNKTVRVLSMIHLISPDRIWSPYNILRKIPYYLYLYNFQ